MAKMTSKDVFAQYLYMSVTMSAANTLTFAQVSIGMSLFEFAAMVICRIDYEPAQATIQELTGGADLLDVAITGSNTITTLDQKQNEVYDSLKAKTYVSGTPGVSAPVFEPIVHDFSGMPGGGILVPAQTIYIGMATSGFSAAGVCNARVWYTVKEMQASDYIELVQRLRVLGTA